MYAPTPQSESIMTVLQAVASLGWRLNIADCKSAFCQSGELIRERGAIYAEPCEGLGMERGQLIKLVAPVYGLNDAPIRWHQTLTDWLSSQGFVKSLLEPCLWIRRAGEALDSFVLIEVDDLIIASRESSREEFKSAITKRFRFGKWEEGHAEFAGPQIRQMPDGRIIVDQEKYVREKLSPMFMERARRSNLESPLTLSEIKSYRSMVAQIQWLGRESRPDVAGSASLLSAALPQPLVSDAVMGLKVCRHLKSSASQKIVIWPIDTVSLSLS